MSDAPRIIIDGFLPDALAYRQRALAQPFYDIRGPDGENYKRISVQPTDEFAEPLAKALDIPVKIGYSLLRLNYADELPNNAIHSDNSYDEFASVLYLNLPEQCQGGTAFWRHKSTGFASFPDQAEAEAAGYDYQHLFEILALSWNDSDAWELLEVVPMQFNRLLVYSTRRFHSRYPFAAFGNTPETGRLIHVSFFSPA
jgi:hypothetical protein